MSHKPKDEQSCPTCGTSWLASELLDCPVCSQSQGPALDQEPMVIKDNDPGDEQEQRDVLDERNYDTSKVRVSLTDLNFSQYAAVSQVLSAALMAFHPEVWMDDPTDITHRMYFMEALLQQADRAMIKLSSDEAHDLKKKLAANTTAIYAAVDIDPAAVQETIIRRFREAGIEMGRDERAAPLDS